MRKALLIFFTFFIAVQAFCQTEFQVQNLATFCKVWGFLKYYHPYPSKKNVDWDTVLTNNYPKIKAAQSKAEFNLVMQSITRKMGVLKPNKHPFVPVDSLAKNADFNWLYDTVILSSQVANYLQEVKKNHKPFKNKYGETLEGMNPHVYENPDTAMHYPDESYRFLALARYWNVINYYAPDKYLMDTNWAVSLKEAIPLFAKASNEAEYYEAIQWICARTNDGHPFAAPMYTKQKPYFYFMKGLPVSLFLVGDTPVITRLLNDSICDLLDVKVGDKIIAIDGERIEKRWQYVKAHNAASNEGAIEALGAVLMMYDFKPAVSVTILRDGVSFEKRLKFYSILGRIKWKSDLSNYYTHKALEINSDSLSGKKYAYLNMSVLEQSKVDSVFKALNGIDYLIVNLRYAPEWVIYDVANYLLPTAKDFAWITEPNYDYPGYFKYLEKLRGGPSHINKDYYKGKVIILINHFTLSRGEYATMLLKLAPTATLIGTQTAGADGSATTVALPGNYRAMFSGQGIFYPNGAQTQRVGIMPDIKVDNTLQSELMGTDPFMQRALELIRTGK